MIPFTCIYHNTLPVQRRAPHMIPFTCIYHSTLPVQRRAPHMIPFTCIYHSTLPVQRRASHMIPFTCIYHNTLPVQRRAPHMIPFTCIYHNTLPVQRRATTTLAECSNLCGRPPQHVPAPCKLTFDHLTLKVVSESRVMWATSLPSLAFLGLSIIDLGPMYATERRQTSDRRQTSIIA